MHFFVYFCRLYQLGKDLKNLVAKVTVGPEDDFNGCLPFQPCDDYTRVPTDNKNKLLLIDKGRGRLIACGSIFQVKGLVISVVTYGSNN